MEKVFPVLKHADREGEALGLSVSVQYAQLLGGWNSFIVFFQNLGGFNLKDKQRRWDHWASWPDALKQLRCFRGTQDTLGGLYLPSSWEVGQCPPRGAGDKTDFLPIPARCPQSFCISHNIKGDWNHQLITQLSEPSGMHRAYLDNYHIAFSITAALPPLTKMSASYREWPQVSIWILSLSIWHFTAVSKQGVESLTSCIAVFSFHSQRKIAKFLLHIPR